MEATTENVVNLSDKAVAQIKELQSGSDDTKGKALRVYVEAGGCSGFEYGMAFDDKHADDLVVGSGGVEVVVDPFSANYLKGSTIDYVDGLQGTGFKIMNPNARTSCGCGKSFEA